MQNNEGYSHDQNQNILAAIDMPDTDEKTVIARTIQLKCHLRKRFPGIEYKLSAPTKAPDCYRIVATRI